MIALDGEKSHYKKLQKKMNISQHLTLLIPKAQAKMNILNL